MDCPGRKSQQLGYTDLGTADLLARCAEENRGMACIHLRVVYLLEPRNIVHRNRPRARQHK